MERKGSRLNNLSLIENLLPLNILVTAAGSANSINVITTLKAINKKIKNPEKKIKIVAIDANPYSAGLYISDRRYVVPKVNDKTFFPKLYEIIEKEKIDLIIPINSKEIRFFSEKKDEIFERTNISMAICPTEVLNRIDDKYEFYKLMKEYKIPTPETEILKVNYDKINSFSHFTHNKISIIENNFNYPFIIKHRMSSGSTKTWFIYNNLDLLYVLMKIEKDDVQKGNYIIQKYIEGIEYTIDFCNDMKGNFIGGVIRERLQVRDGKSIKARTIYIPKIIEYIKNITEKIGYIGPGNFQCIQQIGNICLKKNKNQNSNKSKIKQEIYFTECNPRFAAGGLPLTIHVGFNIPILIIKMLMEPNKKIPHFEYYPENIIMLRYFTETYLE
ncbi:MAG: ATP-grasp domain-containing protein [Promethearchaeota archaeon]